jgi:hypothetical protein
MKLIINRCTLIFLFFTSLSSCGGGGGAGGSSFFGGVYSGVLVLSLDSCGLFKVNSSSVTWTVNQDAERIVLDVSGGGSFAGGPTGDNSFEVGETATDSNNCTSTSKILLQNITDTTAHGISYAKVSCGAVTCEVAYSGPLNRALR